IRDRNAQHVRVKLHVEAVLQAQRLELVLGDFAVDAALDLAAELARPFFDDGLVVAVVLVHRVILLPAPRARPARHPLRAARARPDPGCRTVKARCGRAFGTSRSASVATGCASWRRGDQLRSVRRYAGPPLARKFAVTTKCVPFGVAMTGDYDAGWGIYKRHNIYDDHAH